MRYRCVTVPSSVLYQYPRAIAMYDILNLRMGGECWRLEIGKVDKKSCMIIPEQKHNIHAMFSQSIVT